MDNDLKLKILSYVNYEWNQKLLNILICYYIKKSNSSIEYHYQETVYKNTKYKIGATHLTISSNLLEYNFHPTKLKTLELKGDVIDPEILKKLIKKRKPDNIITDFIGIVNCLKECKSLTLHIKTICVEEINISELICKKLCLIIEELLLKEVDYIARCVTCKELVIKYLIDDELLNLDEDDEDMINLNNFIETLETVQNDEEEDSSDEEDFIKIQSKNQVIDEDESIKCNEDEYYEYYEYNKSEIKKEEETILKILEYIVNKVENICIYSKTDFGYKMFNIPYIKTLTLSGSLGFLQDFDTLLTNVHLINFEQNESINLIKKIFTKDHTFNVIEISPKEEINEELFQLLKKPLVDLKVETLIINNIKEVYYLWYFLNILIINNNIKKLYVSYIGDTEKYKLKTKKIRKFLKDRIFVFKKN